MNAIKLGLGMFHVLKRTQVPRFAFTKEAPKPESPDDEKQPIDDKVHKVESYYAKQLKQIEEQLAQKAEKVNDQAKIIKQLEEASKEHQKKLKELRESLTATVEEQELLVKRTNKEKEQLKVFAITNFAKELLEVQDNLERAIESTNEQKVEDNPLLEGVLMTHSILEKVFQKFGISKMQPLGVKFDPNQHESLFMVEDPEKEAGTVCFVAQSGYVIGERVLRPSKVGVVKVAQ